VQKDNIRLFNKLSGIWTKANLSNDKYINYDFINQRALNHRKQSLSLSQLKCYNLKNHEIPKSTKYYQENYSSHKNEGKTSNFLPVLVKSETTGNEIIIMKKKRLLLNNLQKLNSFNIKKIQNNNNYNFHCNNNYQNNIFKWRKNRIIEGSNAWFILVVIKV